MTDHRAGAGAGATPAAPPGEKFSTYEWQEVCRRARMGRTYSGMAATLAGYADPDGTRVYPGLAGFAHDCEISYNVAKDFFTFMQKVGLAVFVRRRYRHGKRISDEYRLVLDWARIQAASDDDDVEFHLPTPAARKVAVARIDDLKRGKHKPTADNVDQPAATVDDASDQLPPAVDNTDLAAHRTGRSLHDPAAHGTGRRVEAAAHGTTPKVEAAARAVTANQKSTTDQAMKTMTEPETTFASNARSRPRTLSTTDRPPRSPDVAPRARRRPDRPPSARRPHSRPGPGSARRAARRAPERARRRRSGRIASWLRSALLRAGRRRHGISPGQATLW